MYLAMRVCETLRTNVHFLQEANKLRVCYTLMCILHRRRMKTYENAMKMVMKVFHESLTFG